MLMIALKEHGYLGKRRTTGEKFEVTSKKDATILKVARLAREAKKSEMTSVQSTQIKLPAKLEPTPEWGGIQMKLGPTDDGIVESELQIREEEPELEEVETEPIEEQEQGQSSPVDKPKSRRQRRRYKRKDMVPE